MRARFGCFLLFLLSSYLSQPAYSQFSRDYGVGLNSATGALLGTCIDVDKPTITGVGGKSFVYNLQYLETIEDLRKSLSVSASASLQGLWGQADAKTDFFRSVQFNQYSLFMLIKAEIRTDFLALTNPRLKQELRKPQGGTTLTPGEFFGQCGDEFISAIQYGGSIYGLLVVDTRSQTEKESLRVALSASFSAGVSGKGDFQQSIEKVLERTSYHIEYFQEGGNTQGMPSRLDSISSFFDYTKGVEASILANPAVLEIQSKSYRTVDGRLSTQAPQLQRSMLRRLAALELAISQRKSDLSRVLSEPGRFVGVVESDVKKSLDALEDLLNELAFLAEDCFRDAALCDTKLLDRLDSGWQAQAASLPPESALFRALEFSNHQPTAQRVTWSSGGCSGWYYLRLLLGKLQILDQSKLLYEFTCEKSGAVYKCGGGGNDHQFEGNVELRRAIVTADLAVANKTLTVTNVASNLGGDGQCERELVDYLKAKNGTVIPK